MLTSKKNYYSRVSPSEITQISFNLSPVPILNQTIETVPKNEKMHKSIRKKWKYFSRILLRRFTIKFSKELYRVSLTVIQLRKYYIKCKFQRWVFRYKWSKMAHQIYKINYIKIIKERRLKLLEKKKTKLSPNQIEWRIIAKLLITSELRRKLYLERDLLIKQRRMEQIAKWNRLCIKLRPKNLQNIQHSFEERRHIKYIYRKYFIRWLIKYRVQGNSDNYIFKVEYPEMFLNAHLNMSFEFGPYSCPFTMPFMINNISILKDVYDFNETLYNNELENLPDLFILDELENTPLVKNNMNSYSAICSCMPIKIPGIVVPTIFNSFNDMYIHLFLSDDHLNLSASNSLSYFQSCPQFKLNDNISPDVSLSFDQISKESLSHLNNFKEKDHPNIESSNLNMNIPLNFSHISGQCARSLSQFQIKPTIKEQGANVNFNIDLSDVRGRISSSSLLNYKHYVKRQTNPNIEANVPLSFQNISDQNNSNKVISNYKAKEVKNPSFHVKNLYKSFHDFQNSVASPKTKKDFEHWFVNYVDCDDNMLANLKCFVNVCAPKSSNASDTNINIIFIDKVLLLRHGLPSLCSIDYFELPQSNKSSNEVNKVGNSKSISEILPNANSSAHGVNTNGKPITTSEDDITIDIELDLGGQNSPLHPNLEKVRSSELADSKNKLLNNIDQTDIIAPFSDINANMLKSSFAVHPFNPDLSSTANNLFNYSIFEKKNELFDYVDENDSWLNPDYSFVSKQIDLTNQKLKDVGQTLELLLTRRRENNLSNDYEKEIEIEEEEEEFEYNFEEEEEELDINSIDFSYLSPLYLDIPISDILISITKSANSLDSTSLIKHGSGSMASDSFIDSSLKSSRLLEKSRYVPYLFQLASKTFSPLYHSQISKRQFSYDSSEIMVRKIARNPSSVMSKVRYTPSFLNMYMPLIDNIIRLTRSGYSSQDDINNRDLNFGIRPKVIHTSHFLSNVKNTLLPFSFYEKQICDVEEPEFEIEKMRFPLPKVRQTPHIITCIQSTLNRLGTFRDKQVKIKSVRPKIVDVLHRNVNLTDNNNNSCRIVKKKTVRKIKRRSNENSNIINNIDEYDNQNENKVTKKLSRKRVVKRTTEKIVFSPTNYININDEDVASDDDDNINNNNYLEPIKKARKLKSKSSNNSFNGFKSNTKKTKRRATSARIKRQKLPDGTTMTIRKIIIEADSTYDDENEVNKSNVAIVPVSEEKKFVFKSRKRKIRGCSVNNENSSPRKLDQK